MAIYNFSAGPAMLPHAVLEKAQAEMLDWNGSGMSVMEMSHRGKEYMSIAAQAEADLREVMNIPDNYKVLFLQGGASSQFAMVPMNLLRGGNKADYILTGSWGKKAIKEAQRYCEVNVAFDASAESGKFTMAPSQDQLTLLMMLPMCITRQTRPSRVLSSPISLKWVISHWWLISPQRSFRVILMSPSLVSSTPVLRRTSVLQA